MLNISKHNDTKEGLTESQLKERKFSEKVANSINKEIIFGIKTILFISLITIIIILITSII